VHSYAEASSSARSALRSQLEAAALALEQETRRSAAASAAREKLSRMAGELQLDASASLSVIFDPRREALFSKAWQLGDKAQSVLLQEEGEGWVAPTTTTNPATDTATVNHHEPPTSTKPSRATLVHKSCSCGSGICGAVL